MIIVALKDGKPENADLVEAARHKNSTMTLRYAHLIPDVTRARVTPGSILSSGSGLS